ncbi:restriction endonuclease [Streptomyces sp. NBC_01320]|uniref:restriction endonuclease n=1 Tax=Streptomyces sp. NBC_01320 TaxID=2903824 RepID=UPI003FA37D80
MRSIGFTEAQVTGSGADGGIDVIARDAIAQVKHYSQSIGVGPIRELRGVADSHHHLLFYASGGYTANALEFADERGVALFSLLEFGHITPVNAPASRLSARPAQTAGWSRTMPSWSQVASGRGRDPGCVLGRLPHHLNRAPAVPDVQGTDGEPRCLTDSTHEDDPRPIHLVRGR